MNITVRITVRIPSRSSSSIWQMRNARIVRDVRASHSLNNTCAYLAWLTNYHFNNPRRQFHILTMHFLCIERQQKSSFLVNKQYFCAIVQATKRPRRLAITVYSIANWLGQNVLLIYQSWGPWVWRTEMIVGVGYGYSFIFHLIQPFLSNSSLSKTSSLFYSNVSTEETTNWSIIMTTYMSFRKGKCV